MAKKVFTHTLDAAGLYFRRDMTERILADFREVRYGTSHSFACPKVCLNPEHEGAPPAIDVPARKVAGLLK